MPEIAYPGLVIGEEKHVHGEMDGVLKAYLTDVIKNRNKKLSPVWHSGFNKLLDVYLGEESKEFTYKEKKYTPPFYT